MGVQAALWRSVAVFRAAALAYPAVLLGARVSGYSRPALAWSLLGVMAVWTAVAWYGYASPRRRGWLPLGVDMAVTAGCLVASQAVVPPSALRARRADRRAGPA